MISVNQHVGMIKAYEINGRDGNQPYRYKAFFWLKIRKAIKTNSYRVSY